MILHKRIIAYLGTLVVTIGDCAGEQFTALPWEKRLVKGVWGPGCKGDAAFSAGRGQGKSGLVAGIAAACLDPDGPLHIRRGECVITAASFSQGKAAIFEEVLEFMRQKYGPDLPRNIWRMADSQNTATLEHRPTGSRVRVTGCKAKTLHGLRPYLWLLDEPAQIESAQIDAVFAAIKTGLGKVPNSRLFAMGTRPAFPDHPFEKLLTGGAAYSQIHAAPLDAKPFLISTIKKANPSWDLFPSLRERILLEAEDAKRDPSALASYKALRLNQGLSDIEVQLLIGADTWSKAEADINMAGGYALGLDLGTSAAMSAAAGYWPSSGCLDALACFGNTPSLAERGLADGVGGKYAQMYNRGELILSQGRVSKLPDLLSEILDRWGKPSAIICDRWREAELRDALDAGGFPVVPLVIRGMGFKDGGADTRIFQRAVLAGHVHPTRNLLLRYAMSEARTVSDPAGNQKLAKKTEGQRRLKARDDAAAAAILAVAAGYKHRGRQQKRSVYLGRA